MRHQDFKRNLVYRTFVFIVLLNFILSLPAPLLPRVFASNNLSPVNGRLSGRVRQSLIKDLSTSQDGGLVSLKAVSGLDIALQGTELKLGPGIRSLNRWSRPLKDAGNSIANPAVIAKNPDREVYYGYRNVRLAGDQGTVAVNKLRYDITVLLPGLIDEVDDREFIMTKGHRHPASGNKGYPEIYEVWNGKALYVQQGTNVQTKQFEVLATFAESGDKVILLPGYSHRTVNIGNVPLVMANWISLEVGGLENGEAEVVKPDFSDIEANNGYAYHVIKDSKGKIVFRHNPKYGPKLAALRLAEAAPRVNPIKLDTNVPMYRLIEETRDTNNLATFLTTAAGFDSVFTDAFRLLTLKQANSRHNLADGGAIVAEDLSQRLIVKFSEIRKEDVAIAGGKGANLGELQHVKGISVPPGIAVTTKAFKLHVNKGLVEIERGGVKTKITLQEFINQRLAGLNYDDSSALAVAGKDIRTAIEAATMPEEVEKEIEKEYQEMGGMPVAVRSSATAEDMADASFAGQQDTYLNMRGTPEVLNAVKRNWASLFTDRAIFYRHENKIGQGNITKEKTEAAKLDWDRVSSKLMQTGWAEQISPIEMQLKVPLASVEDKLADVFGADTAKILPILEEIHHDRAYLSAIIQVMINSKKAGTAFSVHTDTGFGGVKEDELVISIDGAWGIGEGVVSGATSPDSYIVKKDKSGNFRIYRKVFGAKLKKVVYRKEANVKAKEGTELVDTSYQEQHTFALTDAQVIEVAKAVEFIHKHYGRIMDIEWAFDQEGKLWILQARSETIWNQWKEQNPNTVRMVDKTVSDAAADTSKVLVSGIVQFKAAVGRVVLIDAKKEGTELAKELDRIQQGDILVTTMTKPDMVPGMKRAGAIVTDEGGPTCHAAIIARELEIPCIVGTSKATKVLREGMLITVDANRGKVYDGEKEIEEMKKNIKPLELPETKTKIGVIVASPFLAMKTSLLSLFPSHYGVGLLRKEFADTTEILVHPLAGLAYDLYHDPNFKDEEAKAEIKKNIIDNEELRKSIEDTIKGYANFKEFYKDKLANTLAVIAAAQLGGQRVIMRTTDFKTNEYRDQIGGNINEPYEKNPMMGYRGINRMLSAAYKEAFELEIEAIKQAREMQDNIDVMFPVVRTPVELKQAIDLFAKHGLVRGEKGFRIFMMVEVPANIFQAEEFYKLVDGMSIGSNDLTQFTLALGRDNDKMKKFFDETNPAVKRALEIVIKTAKKSKVKSGLCGQRPSNDPKFAAFLVQAGIDSISVVPQSYEDVVRVVAAQEKELAGKELDLNVVGWSIPEKPGNPQRVVAAEVDAARIIKGLNIHPQILLRYNKGDIKDASILEELGNILEGKKAKDFVVDAVYQAMMQKIKSTPADRQIVYGTDVLDKTEYESLKFGKGQELFDENPQLGFCGLARVVDPQWQEFFLWQLEGIKKAMQDSGRKNVAIKLNLPRILPEVTASLDLIKNAGLTPGKDGFQVGIEIATPSSLLLLDEFIKSGLNFVSENNDRFLSYTMAIDPGNPYLNISEAEKAAALVNPQKVWTTIAERNNIPMVSIISEAEAAREALVNANAAIIEPALRSAAKLMADQLAAGGMDRERAIIYAIGQISKNYSPDIKVETKTIDAARQEALKLTTEQNVGPYRAFFDRLVSLQAKAIAAAEFSQQVVPVKDGGVAAVGLPAVNLPIDILTIDDIAVWQGLTVLDRLDTNAALLNGAIQESKKAKKSVKTVKELSDKGARVVILDHQAKKGEDDFIVDISSAAQLLSRLVGKPVKYVHDLSGAEAVSAILAMQDGEILMLKNVRADDAETAELTPDEHAQSDMVRAIEPLVDVFVNDAFSVSHRNQRSVVGFTEIPNVAGRLMEEELRGLSPALLTEKKIVDSLGGGKVDDLIPMMKDELRDDRVDVILTSGLLGELCLVAKGYNLGETTTRLLEKKFAKFAKGKGVGIMIKELKYLLDTYPDKIIVPMDVAYVDDQGKRKEVTITDEHKTKPVSEYLIGDIGLKTAQQYADILSKAEALYVKGPQGAYDVNPLFIEGSRIVMTAAVNNKDADSIGGGGDTGAVLKALGLSGFKFESTAGGGVVEAKRMGLANLPGVKSLRRTGEAIINMAKSVKGLDKKEVVNFVLADKTVFKSQGGAIMSEYVRAVKNALSDSQSGEQPRALIVAPEFFKFGGVENALRQLAPLSSVIKIGIYGEFADRLRLFLGNNIITGKTLEEVQQKLVQEGVALKDMLVLRSPDDRIDEATVGKLKDNKVKQIVAKDMATTAVVKATAELLNKRAVNEAFSNYYQKLAKDNIITEQVYSATKDQMAAKIDQLILEMPQDIKPVVQEAVAQKIEAAKREIENFVNKV